MMHKLAKKIPSTSVRVQPNLTVLQQATKHRKQRDEKEKPASALLKRYAEAGFGSPSKREVELLILAQKLGRIGDWGDSNLDAT